MEAIVISKVLNKIMSTIHEATEVDGCLEYQL
ncbi:MAG: hypothetical protein QOH70_2382 [Blastocatellia bacterium]|jgi:hypothetical protein|nr:hypothetical protein [Blastocatellia bacterium]